MLELIPSTGPCYIYILMNQIMTTKKWNQIIMFLEEKCPRMEPAADIKLSNVLNRAIAQ